MAILGNSRQLLAIFENFRQPFENLCQPMATYVNFWQFFERILSFHSYPTWCKNSKTNLGIVQFSMKMGWGVQSVFYKVYSCKVSPVYASSNIVAFVASGTGASNIGVSC